MRADMGRVGKILSCTLFVGALCTVGCDESKNQNQETPKAAAAEPEEEVAMPVVPKGPPEFSIDDISPKVGFSRTVLEKDGKPYAQGLEQLKKDLADAKEYIAGKTVTVTVHRQAKVAWVAAYLETLAELGPGAIEIATESRKDYPQKVKAAAAGAVDSPKKCSLVGMILDDRSTAIWRLSGGTARKRSRGMGGPDLTMTGETIERMAKTCQDSSVFFVQGAEGVEWGLVYDLSASAIALEKAGLDTMAVLEKRPVPGHSVQ